MKKTLLFATALVGFTANVMAGEVKTTTVDYQVPTCTNCRTTTTVTTTYPEYQQPVAQPAPVKSVVMRQPEDHRRLEIGCTENHELGIRNPLFVLKQDQVSLQGIGSLYKEPKQKFKNGDEQMAMLGWNWAARAGYGITDRWFVEVLGGHRFWRHDTDQWREAQKLGDIGPGPMPHFNNYDVTGSTSYHLVDLCHFDLIVGVMGGWHRYKEKFGEEVYRESGWHAGPTATLGFNIGWWTPYVNTNYTYGRTHEHASVDKKEWHHSENYLFQPGVYFQPSKYVGFDVNVQKEHHQVPQWNAGIDFYPYKNVTFGAQLNFKRPLKDPMDMYGIAADMKIVF